MPDQKWKKSSMGCAFGWSAARIEEQLVVTKDGCEVITRFPAEELIVAGAHYFTATGPLSTVRETQSQLNNPDVSFNGRGVHAVVAGAKREGDGVPVA